MTLHLFKPPTYWDTFQIFKYIYVYNSTNNLKFTSIFLFSGTNKLFNFPYQLFFIRREVIHQVIKVIQQCSVMWESPMLLQSTRCSLVDNEFKLEGEKRVRWNECWGGSASWWTWWKWWRWWRWWRWSGTVKATMFTISNVRSLGTELKHLELLSQIIHVDLDEETTFQAIPSFIL